MKNELGQSVDHLKRAAALAAQETSATVGPTLTAAVERVQPAASKAKSAASSGWDSAVATITPLVAAATESARAAGENARQAGKATSKSARKSASDNNKKAKKNAKKLTKRANVALGRDTGPKRKSRLLGYALIGTAVGVGAAYVVKRRKAAQWDEYDPAPVSTDQPDSDAAFEPNSVPTANGTVGDPAQQNPR